MIVLVGDEEDNEDEDDAEMKLACSGFLLLYPDKHWPMKFDSHGWMMMTDDGMQCNKKWTEEEMIKWRSFHWE